MYSLNGEPFNARTGAHARARTDTLGHAHMHTNKDSGGGEGGETCGEQTLTPSLNTTGRSNPASPSRAPALKAFHPGPSLLLSGRGWVRVWAGGGAH